MRSERFRGLTNEPGPFVSVYIDDSRDSPEAVERLETMWRELREHLEDSEIEEEVIAAVERAVLHSRPAVGRRGRGVIATRDRVLINEHLVSPRPDTVLRISEYPYVLPLVELGMSRSTYLIAAVDHLGADIAVHRADTVSSETVVGGGYPVHKPVTAGWHGYGDFQHTTEEAIRMNVRAVAERLTKLVDETGAEVVFVCGEVRSRSDVVSSLPERVAALVYQSHAGARGRRIGEDEISDVIDAEFARRRAAEVAEITGRYESDLGRRSGLAASGITAVCAALRAGDVDTLIVGELGDATVVTGDARTAVAPNADVLSELGEAPVRVARADEALPFAAITIGASVVCVDDRIAPTEGIAALLRYAPTDATDPGGTSRQSVAP